MVSTFLYHRGLDSWEHRRENLIENLRRQYPVLPNLVRGRWIAAKPPETVGSDMTCIIRSMTRAGTPTDNPVIESLNGWMKAEFVLDFGIRKVSNFKKALDQDVHYLNSERFAAALDYKTPIQYRTELGF